MRGFQRLRGFKAFTIVTILGNLVISLVLGSIFYKLPDTTESFFARGALLFVAILFNALTSVLEVLAQLQYYTKANFSRFYPCTKLVLLSRSM